MDKSIMLGLSRRITRQTNGEAVLVNQYNDNRTISLRVGSQYFAFTLEQNDGSTFIAMEVYSYDSLLSEEIKETSMDNTVMTNHAVEFINNHK